MTETTRPSLILKRGDPSRRRDNDYDVLEDGKVVGRIFKVPAAAPEGRPWMWASCHGGHHIERARARLCGHARGCDGDVRQELVAGDVARGPALPTAYKDCN